VNLAYNATEKLTLMLNGAMNASEGSLDPVEMPVPEETIEHLDYTLDEMDTYSNIDYTILKGGVGFIYRFMSNLSWNTEASYYDLKDDSGGYVYGDESGSYFVVSTGVRVDF